MARRGACLAALLVGLVVAASWASIAQAAPDPSGGARDHQVEMESVVGELLNDRQPSRPAASGAFGTNAGWERDKVGRWNIALQRQGEHLVLFGLRKRRPQSINVGLGMFNWAFARQDGRTGAFKRAASNLYQYAAFVESVSRSAMVIAASEFGPRYATALERMKRYVTRAARYMAADRVLARGRRSNARYNHREYLTAAAWATVGAFTGSSEFQSKSRARVRAGLKRQRSSGVNPEGGGHDTTYQAIGLIHAMHWLNYQTPGTLTARVNAMVTKGMEWLLARVTAKGNVRRAGDTRTHGQEVGIYDGKIKGVSYASVVRALGLWAVRSQDPRFDVAARVVASRHLAASTG